MYSADLYWGSIQAAQNQQGGFHEVVGHAELKLHNVLPTTVW